MNSKKKIPDISQESKVSLDYILSWGSVKNFLDRISNEESNRAIFLAKRSLIDRRILYYQEKFDEIEYEPAINEENKIVVQKINFLVNEVNKIREDLALNREDVGGAYSSLNKVYQNVKELVYSGSTNSS